MKKHLSAILALALILTAFSALAPTAHAAGETISEEEAKELIEKAYQFCDDARIDDWNGNLVDYKSEDFCEVYVSQIDRTITYRPIDESKLPGGSYSKMCSMAKEIYTEKIAERAYQFSAVSPGGETHVLPMYHIAENGKVYGYGHSEYSIGDIFINLPSLKYSNDSGAGKMFLDIQSGDSKTATAIITVMFSWADGPRPYYYEFVECKFENTADGWRIAESEFSVLMATSKYALNEYRETYPEKVNPEVLKLTDAEAKYVIDEVVLDYFIEMYCGFYQRYVDYVKSEQNEVKEIVKEITASDGSKHAMRYVELLPNMGVDDYAEIYFTDEVSEGFLTKAYHDNKFDMFITEGDAKYMAVIAGVDDLSFVYDPNEVVVEVVESTDKEATARVYCGLKKDGAVIPIYVECKFEKGYSRWYIAESDFVDMLTSADGFEYNVGETPNTGDDSASRIAFISVIAIASIIPAAVIICRKKED